MRILIIEDDPVTASMLVTLLEKKGHLVTVSDSGEEALSISAGFCPELVISDFQLAGLLNGADACGLILARFPNVRVIMMTGLDPDLIRPKCTVARPIAVHQKPLDIALLSRLIEGDG